MMVAAITFLLCSLVAGSAAALYYPRPYQQAEIQSHHTAPSRGCVEIRYYNGGVYYRSYMCDGNAGMCLKVTTCLIVLMHCMEVGHLTLALQYVAIII